MGLPVTTCEEGTCGEQNT